MRIKLAIHHNSAGFSKRWVEYCSINGIEHELIDCYDPNILRRLRDFDGLLWHWTLSESAAKIAAKEIIWSAEMMGIKVYPNSNSCSHYDNKIAQKYIFESIKAPAIPTYIMFNKSQAMQWIQQSDFPKVFKLRCGASSRNVRLVKSRREARTICHKAFGSGFDSSGAYFRDIKVKFSRVENLIQLLQKIKRMPKAIRNNRHYRMHSRERGYIYFQDFLPNNAFDTRITIIGDRAFAYIRNNRSGDFRASGSNDVIYDRNMIDERCIRIAFHIAKTLETQSMAFDFLFDQNGDPKIAEMSYCFVGNLVSRCEGFWDSSLRWKEKKLPPEDAILVDFINEIEVNYDHKCETDILNT